MPGARRCLRVRWCHPRTELPGSPRGRGPLGRGSSLTFTVRAPRELPPCGGPRLWGRRGLRDCGRRMGGSLGTPGKEAGRGRSGEGVAIPRPSRRCPAPKSEEWGVGRGHMAKPTRPVPPSQPLPSAGFRRVSAGLRSTTCSPFNSTQCRPHIKAAAGSSQNCLPTWICIVFIFYLQSRGAWSSRAGIRTTALPLSSSVLVGP